MSMPDPEPLTALAVQCGPAADDLAENLAYVDRLVGSEPADLVVLPELYSRPFWCLGDSDPERFDWSEGLDGPTLSAASDLARRKSATVVAPFFERGRLDGEYYNSAAVIGPDGNLIHGTLPTGREVKVYRKTAISSFRWGDEVNDEKFYFRPGPGYAVFDTPRARLGVLICLDRWFPEAWRVLALAGAEIICVANASQGSVSDMFVASMRTCAAQNLVFTIAVNKVGLEHVGDRSALYYGRSCIVDPVGSVLAQACGDHAETVSAVIDLAQLHTARTERTMYRDRRPELYRTICEDSAE
jgi:N-carbamoylputrescine amidase